jgi:hypothetical protein
MFLCEWSFSLRWVLARDAKPARLNVLAEWNKSCCELRLPFIYKAWMCYISFQFNNFDKLLKMLISKLINEVILDSNLITIADFSWLIDSAIFYTLPSDPILVEASYKIPSLLLFMNNHCRSFVFLVVIASFFSSDNLSYNGHCAYPTLRMVMAESLLLLGVAYPVQISSVQ